MREVKRNPLTASVLAHSARRKNRLAEDNEQILFAKYADRKFGEHGWCHVKNEIGRSCSIGLIMKAKRKGTKKGFPDILIFDTPTNPSYTGTKGLAIELKRGDGGKSTDAQKTWGIALRDRQWIYAVCHGAQGAVSACENAYPTSSRGIK